MPTYAEFAAMSKTKQDERRGKFGMCDKKKRRKCRAAYKEKEEETRVS